MQGTRSGLGPAQTHFGFRYWSFLLGDEYIVAIPYTFWEGFKLGFHLVVGFPSDPGELIRNQGTAFNWAQRQGHRYYSISDLHAVRVVISHGYNHLDLVTLEGQYDHYSIPRRQDTQRWRNLLKDRYSAIYSESGAPKTLFGRVLKS